MFNKIVRLIIAVNNVEEAAKLYEHNFCLQASEFRKVPEQSIKVCHLTNADVDIELVEPLNAQKDL